MRRKDSETYGFTLVAIGLLLGFFLGGSIVYWYSNLEEESFTTDKALNRLSKLFQNIDPEMETIEVIQYPYIKNPKTVTPSLSERTDTGDNNVSYEAIQAEALPPDSIFTYPAITIDANNDNGSETFVPEQPEIFDENIELDKLSGPLAEDFFIKKDQLIGIRGFYLPTHDVGQRFSRGTQTLDSLIGNDQRLERHRKVFYIEFWESPLNYTAYRMTRNRIIIYGLDQIDYVSLQSIENTLFLKYFEDYFPMQLTSEYIPLVPVSDSQLIQKLEQLWP